MTTITPFVGPRWRLATVFAAVAIAAVAGCAGVPAPDGELAAARNALEQAQTAGAPQRAPAEFALARDKFTRAEAAAKRGENTEATRLAEQAQLDAQLAQARTRALGTQRAVSEIEESMRVLRDEMRRKP